MIQNINDIAMLMMRRTSASTKSVTKCRNMVQMSCRNPRGSENRLRGFVQSMPQGRQILGDEGFDLPVEGEGREELLEQHVQDHVEERLPRKPLPDGLDGVPPVGQDLTAPCRTPRRALHYGGTGRYAGIFDWGRRHLRRPQRLTHLLASELERTARHPGINLVRDGRGDRSEEATHVREELCDEMIEPRQSGNLLDQSADRQVLEEIPEGSKAADKALDLLVGPRLKAAPESLQLRPQAVCPFAQLLRECRKALSDGLQEPLKARGKRAELRLNAVPDFLSPGKQLAEQRADAIENAADHARHLPGASLQTLPCGRNHPAQAVRRRLHACKQGTRRGGEAVYQGVEAAG